MISSSYDDDDESEGNGSDRAMTVRDGDTDVWLSFCVKC